MGGKWRKTKDNADAPQFWQVERIHLLYAVCLCHRRKLACSRFAQLSQMIPDERVRETIIRRAGAKSKAVAGKVGHGARRVE